jgi:hypothetical protein
METTMFDTLTRSHLQAGAHHLHTLGPDAVAAFIQDLAMRIGGLPAAVGLLAEYSAQRQPNKIGRSSRYKAGSGQEGRQR